MILQILQATCFTSLCLLVWFETDAIVEYGKALFPTFFDKYNTLKQPGELLPQFIFRIHRNSSLFVKFVTKLQACMYCLSFWVSLISATILTNILFFPIIYIASILLYLIIVNLKTHLEK